MQTDYWYRLGRLHARLCHALLLDKGAASALVKATYCNRFCKVVRLSICLLDTIVHPAKTTKAIDISFRVVSGVCIMNRALNGSPNTPT